MAGILETANWLAFDRPEYGTWGGGKFDPSGCQSRLLFGRRDLLTSGSPRSSRGPLDPTTSAGAIASRQPAATQQLCSHAAFTNFTIFTIFMIRAKRAVSAWRGRPLSAGLFCVDNKNKGEVIVSDASKSGEVLSCNTGESVIFGIICRIHRTICKVCGSLNVIAQGAAVISQLSGSKFACLGDHKAGVDVGLTPQGRLARAQIRMETANLNQEVHDAGT
jgi:hypothetical protein